MLCEISKEVLGLFEKAVLILVLMEDALRGMAVFTVILSMGVLILVLMEDALRDPIKDLLRSSRGGLNPCSNGRCSARVETTITASILEES